MLAAETFRRLVPLAILFLAQCFSAYIDTLSWPLLYIGVPDEAEVALAAKSIAQGNGPWIGSVEFLHGDASPRLPHLHRYWSVYLSYWVAPFFWLFGPNRFSVLLSASVLKSILSTAVFLQLRTITRNKWSPLIAGCIILFDRTWSDRVNLYSDLFLATLVTILSCSFASFLAGPKTWKAVVTGLIAGLCIGAKPTGIFISTLPVIISVLYRGLPNRFRWGILYATGMSLGALPLVANNLIEGSLFWPDAKLVSSAASLWSEHDVPYLDAFYDPDNPIQSQGMSLRTRMRRLIANLADFTAHLFCEHSPPPPFSSGQSFSHRSVLIGHTFSFLVLPTLMMGIIYFRRTARLSSTHFAVANFAVLSFVVAVSLCAIAHYEARYYLFAAAPLLISALSAPSFPNSITGIVCGIVLIQPVHDIYSEQRLPFSQRVLDKSVRAEVLELSQLSQVIPEDSVVMAENASVVAFHLNRRTVTLPRTTKILTLRRISLRYNASVIIARCNPNATHKELVKALRSSPEVKRWRSLKKMTNYELLQLEWVVPEPSEAH